MREKPETEGTGDPFGLVGDSGDLVVLVLQHGVDLVFCHFPGTSGLGCPMLSAQQRKTAVSTSLICNLSEINC